MVCLLPYLEIISPNSKASSNNITNLPNTMPIMHKPVIHMKIKLVIIVGKIITLHQIVSKRNEREAMGYIHNSGTQKECLMTPKSFSNYYFE
jgi:hypothetical protein